MKSALLILLMPNILLAEVILNTSRVEVYHRGEIEQGGDVTLTVSGNDFSTASPDQPIYIQFRTLSGVVNADTLVDLSSDLEPISRPVYLAMRLISADNLKVVAPPETVSIVRWVKGEDAIWLRVQTSSDTWLMDEQGMTLSPSDVHRVAWTFGIDARSSSIFSEPVDNLPFNTRNRTPQGTGDAISTNRALDLSNSSLGFEASEEALLYQNVSTYGADADQGDGTFAPGTPSDVEIPGTRLIARGKLREISTTVQALDLTGSVDAQDGSPVLRRVIQVSPREAFGETYVKSALFKGATLTLSTMGNSGFVADGAVFVDGCDRSGIVAVNPQSAFDLDGRTVYGEITLTWDEEALALDEHPDLSVLVSLSVPTGQFDTLPELAWTLEQSGQGLMDTGEFNGPEQRLVNGFSHWKTQGIVNPLTRMQFHDRILPHITRPDGGFETVVDLINPYNSEKGYLIHGFREDGTFLGSNTGSLPAGGRQSLAPEALFNDPDLSHLTLSEITPIRAALTYRAKNINGVAATVPETENRNFAWLIWPGNPNITFDGLALVNLHHSPVEVTLWEVNGAGEIINTTVLAEALPPMGKLRHVLQPTEEGTYFEVTTGNLPTVVTALRGNADAGFLWVNQAVEMQMWSRENQ